MDLYGNQKFTDLGEEDFNDILEQDVFPPVSASDVGSSFDSTLGSSSGMESDWLCSFFDDPVVLNDKMISETLYPAPITNEHSYSSTNSPGLQVMGADVTTADGVIRCDSEVGKMELSSDEDGDDEDEQESKHESLLRTLPTIKQEPLDGPRSVIPVSITHPAHTSTISAQQTRLLHSGQSIILTNSAGQPLSTTGNGGLVSSAIATTTSGTTTTYYKTFDQQSLILQPNITVKLEPNEPDYYDNAVDSPDSLTMPPTPPSSSTSDSEGGYSPRRSAPSSPIRLSSSSHHIRMHSNHQYRSQPYTQPLFTSPIPQSGVLILSDEEKRTLITEGYPVPSKLPLNKQEEKNLKKIRRKIKNKISAQESRRKKKEYVETLEKKMESFSMENCDLRKKVDNLENNNRSLLSQLQKLQSLINNKVSKSITPGQTSTCLMVMVLCFAVILGSWSPSQLNLGAITRFGDGLQSGSSQSKQWGSQQMGPKTQDSYNTPNMRSRMLLSVIEDNTLEDVSEYDPGVHTYQELFVATEEGYNDINENSENGSLIIIAPEDNEIYREQSNDTLQDWEASDDGEVLAANPAQLNVVAVDSTHINATRA